jgi:hypothetical protein
VRSVSRNRCCGRHVRVGSKAFLNSSSSEWSWSRRVYLQDTGSPQKYPIRSRLAWSTAWVVYKSVQWFAVFKRVIASYIVFILQAH